MWWLSDLRFSPVYHVPCSRNAEQRIGFGTLTSINYAHDLKDGVLIVIHTYTGCDTVSAFADRGKLGALKLMRSEHCQEIFRDGAVM